MKKKKSFNEHYRLKQTGPTTYGAREIGHSQSCMSIGNQEKGEIYLIWSWQSDKTAWSDLTSST